MQTAETIRRLDWRSHQDRLLSAIEDEPRVRLSLASALAVALVVFTGFSVISGVQLGYNWPLKFGGVSVYVFDVLLAGAMATALLRRRPGWRRGLVRSNVWVLQVILTYIAYQVLIILPLAVAFTDNGFVGTVRILDVRFAVILIAFFYPFALADFSPRHLIRAFDIAALCVVAVAVARFVANGPTTFLLGDVLRMRELWGGSSLLFGWLIISRLFLHRATFANALCVAAGLVGVVLVNHRSAYIALVAAVGVQLALFARSRKRLATIALLTISSALALALAPTIVRSSTVYSLSIFVGHQDANTTDRLTTSAYAWDYFQAHPLGDFALSGEWYLPGSNAPAWGAHNFVMEILQTEGLPGALFYAALLGIVFRIVVRNRQRDQISTTMGSYLVFYLVFAFFNTNIYSTPNLPLLAAAVGIILYRNEKLAEVGRSRLPPTTQPSMRSSTSTTSKGCPRRTAS